MLNEGGEKKRGEQYDIDLAGGMGCQDGEGLHKEREREVDRHCFILEPFFV